MLWLWLSSRASAWHAEWPRFNSWHFQLKGPCSRLMRKASVWDCDKLLPVWLNSIDWWSDLGMGMNPVVMNQATSCFGKSWFIPILTEPIVNHPASSAWMWVQEAFKYLLSPLLHHGATAGRWKWTASPVCLCITHYAGKLFKERLPSLGCCHCTCGRVSKFFKDLPPSFFRHAAVAMHLGKRAGKLWHNVEVDSGGI